MSDRLDDYNVEWDSPSKDSSGSMPIGNGDLGANVWVEENGDVVLLLGKTDAWDENSSNLKLGRIRLRCSPGSVVPFNQMLRLRTGDIQIVLGAARLRIWVDANHPVIHIEADGDATYQITATVEIWRIEERMIKTQTGDLFRNLSGKDPYPTVVSPDRVLQLGDDTILWRHHNTPREHDGYEINMRLQGLGDYIGQTPHPLSGRTFGAAMKGPGFRIVDENTLVSRPASSHHLSIYALTMHPVSPEPWLASIRQIIAAGEQRDHASNRREHENWWTDFWNRSAITIDAPPSSDAFHVARGYALQRFMNACGGRGAQPIKFNGSIFTVGKDDDPDFRRWGGPGFWFMNMRLIYWPMLASGDFDLMRPWLRMYLDMLPLQKHRTRTYYGHGGAHYPETITFWGAEVSAHYGWTPFEQRKQPEAECSYVTYYWTCGIELSLVLWNYFVYTGDEAFAREFLLPIADAVTEFFDVHYPRDAAGKICFEPGQALETWQDATNPLPEIAGLRYLLPKLIDLPAELATDAQRERWKRMIDEIPPIPVGEKNGQRVILPAERFDKLKNTENPELYAIFPFHLFGVGKPELQLARDTFAARLHPSHDCWSQDDVQMAYLGLTEQAKEFVSKRASPASHSDSRFPAFWNAFHDWLPDMDHGGVLQLALQSMLMQCEGQEIRLLPAWPSEWDADFKLHAPRQTIVQGKVRGGRIEELQVTPDSRRADVILP
jgi:alpha-L-fucosidase 2